MDNISHIQPSYPFCTEGLIFIPYTFIGGISIIIQKEYRTGVQAKYYLRQMKKLGIKVFINDVLCSYQDIESIHKVFEENCYMSDYETNEEGRITKVDWKKITRV